MAATPSVMVELGSKAPSFTLHDTISNKPVGLEQLKGDVATVIMFICNHCPYVKHINKELVHAAKDYIPLGVSFIAISSNDVENYPDDSPENMQRVAREEEYPFPYLYDATQDVARAYDAACTPDFFVYDAFLQLVYRGQFDDSRPGNGILVTGRDLRGALQALIDGKPVAPEQTPSIGCGIKWKK